MQVVTFCEATIKAAQERVSAMCPTSQSNVLAQVLALLEDRGEHWRWTTTEIAEALGVKEYAVRGSVSALQLRCEVIALGRVTRYTVGGYPYFVVVYGWSGPKQGAPDVAALYRALGLSG